MSKPIRPEHARYEERYRAVYAAGVPFAKFESPDDHFERFLKEQSTPGRLLDLGCGEGGLAALAAGLGFEVLAVDSAPSAIAKARATRKHPNLTFMLADVCELDGIAADSFDIAVDLGCLHVIVDEGDARRCIAHAFRIVKPGGLAYYQNLVGPDDAAAWCPWERDRVEWWRKRITEDRSQPITDSYEVDGRTIEVERPRSPAAFRDLRQQVALLTEAGFRVEHAEVITPGANSPFEAVIIARKPG